MNDHTRRVALHVPALFAECVTDLLGLMPDIKLQYGERKIDIKTKIIDKNCDEKYITQKSFIDR